MEAREIERCIDAFGADVFRFCRRLCADRADADDLYQQVFLRALEARVALDWASNPRALFFSLAYRLWKSDARKRARRQVIAPSECLDDAPADALCAPEDLQERVENAQRDAAIRAIVRDLPEKLRIPVELYYLGDCTVEQIARTIQRPRGTVKSRLFQARETIRKRLEEAGYEV